MAHDVLIHKLRSLVELTADDERAVRSLSAQRTQVSRHRDILPRLREPDFVYVIVSGWAARYGLRADGSRRITGFMLRGDFCGIHAVAGAAMDHAIVAITDCEMAAIPIAEMEALVARVPLIGKALWRAKLIDEAILRQWLLSSGDALQAIARMLCELHARARAAELYHDGACEVPITQEQLGDAVGLTGVHTNRTLQKLRSFGYIEFANGHLRILQPQELTTLAQWNDRYLAPWQSKDARRLEREAANAF